MQEIKTNICSRKELLGEKECSILETAKNIGVQEEL